MVIDDDDDDDDDADEDDDKLKNLTTLSLRRFRASHTDSDKPKNGLRLRVFVCSYLKNSTGKPPYFVKPPREIDLPGTVSLFD